MTETFSDLAPLLGVVLTAIGAFFMYRRTEVRREQQHKDDSRAALLATAAGAVAGHQNGKLYIEEFQRLIASIDRLTDAQHISAQTHKEGAQRWKDVLEELELHRRAMQEVVALIRRHEDRSDRSREH